MGFMDFFMGSEGTPGEHGIDVFYPEEYDDYADIRKDLVNYYGGVMQGQEPAFFQSYLPGIEQQQEEALNRYYLGDPGYRGTSAMGLAEQRGAKLGVGPKATAAMGQKVDFELAAKKAAAKAAMDKYRLNWMGNAQWKATEGLQGLPRTPEYYASGYEIQPGQGSQGLLQGAANAWAGSGFPGLGGLMSKMPGFGPGGMFGQGSNNIFAGDPTAMDYTFGNPGSTGQWSGDIGNIGNTGSASIPMPSDYSGTVTYPGVGQGPTPYGSY
jgi:hypothetical protein